MSFATVTGLTEEMLEGLHRENLAKPQDSNWMLDYILSGVEHTRRRQE